MKKVLFFLTVSLLSSAFAGSGPKDQVQQLTFDDLKEACSNPQSFHSQNQPKNIKILCENQEVFWQNGQHKNLPMEDLRSVTAALISDKYQVQAQEYAVPLEQKVVQCPTYQEMKQDFKVEVNLTCEELLAHEGTLGDLCLGAINKTDKSVKDMAQVQETGRAVTLCASEESFLQN